MKEINSYISPVSRVLGIEECEIDRRIFSSIYLELYTYLSGVLKCDNCITDREFVYALALTYEAYNYTESDINPYIKSKNYLKSILPKAKLVSRKMGAY
jgi:hypothetical protein